MREGEAVQDKDRPHGGNLEAGLHSPGMHGPSTIRGAPESGDMHLALNDTVIVTGGAGSINGNPVHERRDLHRQWPNRPGASVPVGAARRRALAEMRG